VVSDSSDNEFLFVVFIFPPFIYGVFLAVSRPFLSSARYFGAILAGWRLEIVISFSSGVADRFIMDSAIGGLIKINSPSIFWRMRERVMS